MKIGSLFTGTGALDLAARAVFGGEVAWHSDIKPAAVTFLEHRFPATPNLGDITLIDPRDVAPIDVLTFGWPCQPHSAAGLRLGEKDPRALWPEVARLIDGLRPRILLGENVARVISNGELRRVATSLAALGYVGAWRCVTAASVWAPHKRDRLFLLALRADVAADSLGLLVRDESGWSGGPGGPGARVTGDDGAAGAVRLLKTPTANLGSNGGTQHPDKRKAGGHGPTLADEVEWLLPTPKASDGPKGGPNMRGSSGDLSMPSVAIRMANESSWGHYASAIARWEQRLGRPAPEPTTPAPRARNGRSLNPAFVEWMMGLPAGWVTDPEVGLPRAQQLSMLGDGVVPRQAEAAYRVLLHELTDERVA